MVVGPAAVLFKSQSFISVDTVISVPVLAIACVAVCVYV